MSKKVLILRTCDEHLRSHGGFQWPKKGDVEAPDWKPAKECGNGLHGFLWGEGDGSLANWDESAKWLVVEALESDVLDLGGKVKFPRGKVVFCGSREKATAYMAKRAPGRAIVGGTSTSGDRGTSTSGYHGTSTSGDRGTSTSGVYGTSTSGDYGTSTSGAGGTSTSGNYGTSTSGVYGTSTSGVCGTSTSGVYGTSTSGNLGIIESHRWDGERYRVVVGHIGEDGLKPNTPYRLDAAGKWVEATPPPRP